MKFSTFILFLFFGFHCFSQTPGITFIDNPLISGEANPGLFKSNTGGYLSTNTISKSNPDSLFAVLTSMNSSLVPQWSKIFKLRSTTVIANLEQEQDGKISILLNGYNTQSSNFPVFVSLSPTGEIIDTREIVDSNNLNQTGSVYLPIKVQNNSQWLFSRKTNPVGMFRLNSNNEVTFSKQPVFNNQASQYLSFSTAKVIPGGNKWVGAGRILNTNLAFYLQMDDSLVKAFYVYNVPNSSSTINEINLLPNSTDMIIVIGGGVTFTHLARINENGGIIWKKSFKLPNVSLSESYIDSNGEIWLHGSTSPLASGVLSHFSASGDFISLKCQFKIGNSLSRITGFLQVANNEFLTIQSAFYNSSNCLIVNRINSDMNFLCFNYPISSITDTSFNFVDSASTQISFQPRKKLGIKSNLSFPILTFSQNLVTGNVTCPTTEIIADFKEEKIQILPNPGKDEIYLKGIGKGTNIRILATDGKILTSESYSEFLKISHLPKGIYLLEIPEKQIMRRFVKD